MLVDVAKLAKFVVGGKGCYAQGGGQVVIKFFREFEAGLFVDVV